IEDTSGWALLSQDKADEAVGPLKRAISILPEGTPAARAALWHLGVALERQDKKAEALSYYIKSYNSGDPDPVRRSVLEQLYRKVNGSLEGLDQRIGPAAGGTVEGQPPAVNNPTEKTAEEATTSPAVTSPADTAPAASASPSPEAAAAAPESTPASATPTPSPDHPAVAPSPEPTPDAVPAASPETPVASP